VDLSIQSGEAALNGFTMGNPAGFNTPKAMSFGVVSVKLDTGSIASDTILIREVVIAKPEITYELGAGGSNIGAIQKNVDSFAKAAMGPGGAARKESDSAGGKKVVIENLYVRDGKISVSATFLQGKEMGAPLPTIHLKDIGKSKGGATPAEVADQLMTAITRSATSAVSALNLDKLKDAAEGAKKMLEGGAEGAKKMLEGGAGGATKTLEDATKGVGDSLKGLMGK
jgi:uncharacterized protein involved in outer membrane biogenesis